VPVVRASAEATPFRDDCFDVALLLGVVSVVPASVTVLAEAGRLAPTVAVLEYVSVGTAAVRAGGSVFPTRCQLASASRAAGLEVVAAVDQSVPAPPSWTSDSPAPNVGSRTSVSVKELEQATDSEQEVADAIARGRLIPHTMLARRQR